MLFKDSGNLEIPPCKRMRKNHAIQTPQGICTIKGNTGTQAAIGTTLHTATFGCFHLCQAISQAL